jgi:4-amino-4-deoxy-L-arabinose transferase-like glycosyltransferase
VRGRGGPASDIVYRVLQSMGMVAERRAEVAVGVLAVVLRLAHNAAMMTSPLYAVPLGGHVVFLDQAERIAGGAFVPERAFSDNSPLFPYVLAVVFAVAGGRDLLLARLLGILVDGVTAMLVTRLATRRFGSLAGIVAGVLYATYGPAVFFAAELIYIPYALFFCVVTVLLLTNARATVGRGLAAGVTYGLATGFMPSLLVGAPLLAVVAASGSIARTRMARAGAALLGVAIAIAPVTALNYAASGKLVLLTMSSGHAFYLGHNPQARAGYYLPDRVGAVQAANRGSIFESMHRIAEEAEGHSIPDEAVSSYYFGKAWQHVAANPGLELRLLATRLAAFCNWYEATTYADFYFQREESVVLRALPTYTILFALSVVGLLTTRLRRELPLLLFPLTSLVTVLVFFYLARFRMPAVPFLCCFAGRGVASLVASVRRRRVRRLVPHAVAAAVALVVASWPMVAPDTSNEWNKVGTLYLAMKRYPDAESAFEHAAAANPGSPFAYLNLQRVYDATGATERAQEARAMADGLIAGEQAGFQFRQGLHP